MSSRSSGGRTHQLYDSGKWLRSAESNRRAFGYEPTRAPWPLRIRYTCLDLNEDHNGYEPRALP